MKIGTDDSKSPVLALFARPPALPGRQQLIIGIRNRAECALGDFKRALNEIVNAVLERKVILLQSLTSALLLPHQLRAKVHEIRNSAARIQQQPMRLRNCHFASVIPGDSVAEFVVTRGISNFFNIYNGLLVVRILLSWFPEAPRAIVNPVSTVCDPYLNLFRGIIPPLGGTLDFSPILAFLLLDTFTNAAAALPAELPPSMQHSSVQQHKKIMP